MNQNFKHIVSLLRKLPGVGPRQAARFVLSLMNKSDTELEELGTAITNLRTNISFCNICFNISDNHICGVCSDKKRDRTKIMVLEKVTDLESIEKTGLYRGLYHILGGAINPIDGVLPENLRLRELDTRISNTTKDLGEVELILATNPNTAGETTAMYVRDMLDKKDNVRITHLARGLASGSHLEYIDEITLKNALEFRK
ncbi:MAG: recombination protein RecR [Candidatus Yanofskybacteria bacterium RIFOXYD1_FULL_44_17]|uniref:Recombination protein RecR n=1 Tax=Candidatus Yanofskybacteria bacterium GW2011_GWE2_40_11 TaxID=1619033 RepID=A0A0G0TQW8_9BACT|nr:MAG: Recombination protein RecR [Candidatus Yanofskybacteria bacterium GW2011_GWE1_40_10]KKR40232.1 MAG: Recombination protein RecR [Candidatus Yanofskybacteria bacterium GW2011_GWE2_40_11]OGN36144.1 MAG: recombination protein RecR [Candidatus Yanofskybacteria bacterium RIFOXYA2_FULL_45_28]OGN36861.1 MAG: recombination protein RecR [Candidatus Yanofskybacteria bacterium RIFOXYA1_FULL_44_17]OGN38303.1 MAG: recombination protein RecR [Candidatus Yanofskybacteria bacterium RIFOXYC1_FULL_44_16]